MGPEVAVGAALSAESKMAIYSITMHKHQCTLNFEGHSLCVWIVVNEKVNAQAELGRLQQPI